MQFKIKRKTISSAISRIGGVIQPKSTLPVIQNVLVEAKEDSVILTATDLEMFIRITEPAVVTTPGKTSIPLKRLSMLINKYNTEDIEITTDSTHRSVVSGGTGNVKLNGLDPIDFPEIPQTESEMSFTLPSEGLFRGIELTDYAVNPSEGRKALQGVNISIGENGLAFAGTDGRRVAVCESGDITDAVGTGSFTIPIQATAELKKFLPKEGNVTFRQGNGRICVEYAGNCFTAKLLTDNYPNYRQVIPAKGSNSFEIPCKEFLDKLELVGVAGEQKGNDIIKFSVMGGKISVSMENAAVGSGIDTLDIEFSGKINFLFNFNFIADPFRNADSDKLNFTYTDETSPVRIENDKGFLYVLVPMKNK